MTEVRDGWPRFRSEYGRDAPHPIPPDRPGGDTGGGHVRTSPELVADSVLSRPLQELMRTTTGRIGVVIELRVRYEDGLGAAAARVRRLLPPHAPVSPPLGPYLTTELTPAQIRRLVAADSERADAASDGAPGGRPSPAPRGALHRLWPNFEIGALTTRSIVTTKCQAAHRAFNAGGQGVVWAVLDSGIDAEHDHFRLHRNLDGLPHRSFVDDDDAGATRDEAGHGTHVAGILAGRAEGARTAATWYHDDDSNEIRAGKVTVDGISGMAPECKLLSCKVLRADETGDVTALLAALRYIDQLNGGGRDLQVHGVNISVGHPFDPSWFATGLTPVCREVDRLVRSGVLVVVAAGNSGYGYALDRNGNSFRLGFDMTINDPGNAALGLTVGSTSCSPHSTGVSFFSSKGPTGDGRMKPDLVAPGERIVSAAAGALAAKAKAADPAATYVENSGTSMAAPHVSGAAAAFLSVHREFLGRPDEVVKALVGSATDLGRSPHFQGAGLLDAMRAIQSV